MVARRRTGQREIYVRCVKFVHMASFDPESCQEAQRMHKHLSIPSTVSNVYIYKIK